MNREAGPRVEQAENLADNVKNIARCAPPMSGVEWVSLGVTDDQFRTNFSGLGRSEPVPDGADAASVWLGGDDNCSFAVLLLKEANHGGEFVLGVGGFLIQDADGVRGNTFGHENFLAVELFAHEGDAHLAERFGGPAGMSDPDAGSDALFVKASGFYSAKGHASTEDDDGVSGGEVILDDEPAADPAKNDDGGAEAGQSKAYGKPAPE
jgi:hypothetical protein